MRAYYNEFDRGAAAWLRELIARGLIAPGDVDERSIVDVKGSDLDGYTQCHFFAGIGGWAHALDIAGWGDRPVWTGSCPCQPFSAAGKRRGTADARHLWPEFRRLIAECRPPVVFGEEVASPAGRRWLAGVRTDMEALGYAVGAADLCAAGVGAPHIRQRLYWVADADVERAGGIWHAGGERSQRREQARATPWPVDGATVLCRDGRRRRLEPGIVTLAHGVPARVVRLRGFGNAIVPQVAAEFIRAYIDSIAIYGQYQDEAMNDRRGTHADYIEIRRCDDGTIDEIVAVVGGKCVLHLELMDDCLTWMSIEVGGERLVVHVASASGRAKVNVKAEWQ